MRSLNTAFIMLLLFSVSLISKDIMRSLLIHDDPTHIGSHICGGSGDNLYMAIDSLLYQKSGIDGEWSEIYQLPNDPYHAYAITYNDYRLKFYKDDSFNVYFALGSIFYKIDSQTQVVDPVYSTNSKIKSAIFEDDKIILMEEDKFHILTSDFEQIEVIDMSSLSDLHFIDFSDITNRIAYIRGEGYCYNVIKPETTQVLNSAFVSTQSIDSFPEFGKFYDTEAKLHNVANLTNNLILVSEGDDLFDMASYIYDLKTKSRIFIPSNPDFKEYRFQFEESGDILTLSFNDINEFTQYSTDRGKTWTEVSSYTLYELCVTESGQIYGFYPATGLIALDNASNKWNQVNLPGSYFSYIKENTKDYFEQNNAIKALWKNNSIITSTNNGKTWTQEALPVETQNADALFVDSQDNYIYLCEVGLYKKEANATWELLSSELPYSSISDCKIIDVNDMRILIASSQNDTDYQLFEFSLTENKFTDLSVNFRDLQKSADGNFYYVPKNDMQTIIKSTNDFTMVDSKNLNYAYDIDKILLDKIGSIYVATQKGLFKSLDWNSDFEKLGNINNEVENMHLNSNDTMFVNFKDSEYFYFVEPYKFQIETIPDITGWQNKSLAFISANNTAIIEKNRNGTLSYVKLLQDMDIHLNYSVTDSCFEYDSKPQLLIYPNAKDYDIKIIDYSSLADTTLIATGDTAVYNIDFLPHQNISMRIVASVQGKNPFYSDIINIKTYVGRSDTHIIAESQVGSNDYKNTFDTGKSGKYKLSIVDGNGNPVDGLVNIHNSFNNETQNFNVTSSKVTKYEFEIPSNSEYGIYKLSYSGKADDLGEVPESYLYFIIHGWIWDSVEELNSIIKNAKVFPNPTANSATVDFKMEEAGDLTCEIYDLSGKRIMSIPTEGYYAAGQANLSFDVSMLQSGQYMIFLKAKDKVTASKLIIER